MDVNTLYHRTVEFFADRVNAVKDDQWGHPTPCPAWTVRDLVNHITYENLWTVPLMEGATIEEVGDRFDGDMLGEDPIGAALVAARNAISSVATQLPLGGTVHLSFGETPKQEYAMQLAADHLVHGWDLAVSTGGDTRMDPHLVHGVAPVVRGPCGGLPRRGRRRRSAASHWRRSARPAGPIRSRRGVGSPPSDTRSVQRGVRRGGPRRRARPCHR